MLTLRQCIDEVKRVSKEAETKSDYILASLCLTLIQLLEELQIRRGTECNAPLLRILIRDSKDEGPRRWKAWCPDLPENPPVAEASTATEAVGLLISTLDLERDMWKGFAQIPKISRA